MTEATPDEDSKCTCGVVRSRSGSGTLGLLALAGVLSAARLGRRRARVRSTSA
jgi:hypothetical protein